MLSQVWGWLGACLENTLTEFEVFGHIRSTDKICVVNIDLGTNIVVRLSFLVIRLLIPVYTSDRYKGFQLI